jgi:His-Xaa-Ser system protein HxsD
MEQSKGLDAPTISIEFEIEHSLISIDAILKTCYWFSRDHVCGVTNRDGYSTITLAPKVPEKPFQGTHDLFLAQAMDFELRERISAKTADVRNLLLAKAFSEAGVLEDQPRGTFGDRLEEAKSDGMFRILSNR